MPNATPDRRIARTRNALRDALLTLLSQQAWDDITIQALCDTADIGRSTFYARYTSKDELLSESLNDLRDYLLHQAAAQPRAGLGFLPGLLQHAAEQRAVFRAVIGRRSGLGVARRFEEMVQQLVAAELQAYPLAAADQRLAIRFISGGLVAALAAWVDATAPQEIDRLLARLDAMVMAALAAAPLGEA